MKKFIPLLLAVFAVTLASCEKDPDMDKLDNNYLVYTNYDKKADFKTFETYYLPDSILVIGDKENAESVSYTHLDVYKRQASHYLEVELQPGESRDFIFLLGYVENKQEAKFEEREESLHEAFKQSVPSSPIINKVKAKAMISAFDTTAKVDAAFAELKAYWDRLLDIYVCLLYTSRCV